MSEDKRYRCRAIFTKQETESKDFEKMLDFQERIMNDKLKDAEPTIYLYHRLRHEEDGLVFYDYFETEEERIIYLSALRGDRNIYKQWLAQIAEHEELRKYKYSRWI